MPKKIADAVDWLKEFQQFWGKGFDQLDSLLVKIKQAQTNDINNE
jgi:hypothetical protein